MKYKGFEIEDKIWATTYEDYYLCFDSNEFELTAEMLESLSNDLKEKEQRLIERGVEFKNLRYDFYATEYREYDHGDQDAECIINFAYDVPETEEESKKRIEKKKKWIDKQLEDKQREEAAAERKKNNDINNAIQILEQNGFSVSKK